MHANFNKGQRLNYQGNKESVWVISVLMYTKLAYKNEQNNINDTKRMHLKN